MAYTKKELAEKLHCSPRTIERWVKKGKMPKPFKPDPEGRIVLFHTHEIDEWLLSLQRRVY